jgi:hypothetical protein
MTMQIETPKAQQDSGVRGVTQFLRQNPNATRKQIAEGTGMKYCTTVCLLLQLERKGAISHVLHESTGKVRPGSRLEAEIVADLRDGIEPMSAIGRKRKLHPDTIKTVNMKHGLRTKVVINHTHDGLGLNPDRLPEPVTPLTVSEKQAIMREYAPVVNKMLEEFPDRTREELKERAATRVWGGLAKYHKDLMSQRHFVMLVTKKAIYEYIQEQKKRLGVRRVLAIHKRESRTEQRREVSDAEAARLGMAIEQNLDNLNGFALSWRKAIAGAYDPGDIVQQAVIKAYSEYDPAKHPDMDRFLFNCAVSTAKKARNHMTGEGYARGRIYLETLSQTPHMQNRRKNNDPRYRDK